MPRKPTTVRIGRDSKGAYIKYGRQKIYISKSVQQRLASMGRESLTEFLVKWIVKHFSRRRRRRTDRKASKEFGPPPKSIGTAGLSEAKVKSLPLEAQRQHLVALSLLARPVAEQQRYLEDKRQETKQSSDAKNNQRFIESTKDTPPSENSAMMRLALGQAAKEITELKRQIRQSLPQNIEGTQSYIAARQKEIEDLEKQQDQLRRKIDEVRDGTAYHPTQGDNSWNKQLKSLGVQPGKWSRKRSLQVLKERLEELDEDPAEKKAYSAALKKLPYLRDPEKYQEEIRKHDESITTINLQIRTAEDYLKELQKPPEGPTVEDLDDDYRTPPEAPASPPVSKNATILPPGAKGEVKVEEPEDSDADDDDVMFHSESPRARMEGTLEGAGLKTRQKH